MPDLSLSVLPNKAESAHSISADSSKIALFPRRFRPAAETQTEAADLATTQDAAADAQPPSTETRSRFAPRDPRPLGEILLEDGAVSPGNLLKAVVIRDRQQARLGDTLLAHGWVTEAALSHALSRQWRASVIDLIASPPDPRLIDALTPDWCLRHATLPWRRVGGVTYFATARPEAFDALAAQLPKDFGPVRLLISQETTLHEAVLRLRRRSLIRSAENQVPESESCRPKKRSWRSKLTMPTLLLMASILCLLWPAEAIIAVTLWTLLSLMGAGLFKVLALHAAFKITRTQDAHSKDLAHLKATPDALVNPLPVISVIVPLYRESDIAERLIARLARLDYPRELTDILLAVEESDQQTRTALQGHQLPAWMRVVTVPDGPLRTKPRALNYAMNFARGSIVGIWDAEDRPAPDQLHRVARRFDTAPNDLACVQGSLDYYNPRHNWMSRCFTIEYASWFRVLLPGVSKLGLVVPLGGTTLFFRRDLLEQIGGWDAWNVTEDADLGVRLVRRGLRTEMLDSTTMEEANCRPLPWIRQRSRWLKGYAMTWAVHMRNPLKLLQDLGPKRFVFFQIQFLGTFSQFLLAPVLWSFWLLALGFPHPLREPLIALGGNGAMAGLFVLSLVSEIINAVIACIGLRRSSHRGIAPWVATMPVYFPLACFAAWKAFYEIIAKPFYWDKTTHGVCEADPELSIAATTPDIPAELTQLPLLGKLDAEPPAKAVRQNASPVVRPESGPVKLTAITRSKAQGLQ